MDDLSAILATKDPTQLIKLAQKKLEILKDDLSSLPNTDQHKVGKFAASVLSKLTEYGVNVKKILVPELLQCAYLCVDSLEICKVKGKKLWETEKHIYHIVCNLFKEECFADCYGPAAFMYPKFKRLLSANPDASQTMTHNLHVYLWNASAKLDTMTGSDQIRLIFQMRLLGVLYCFIGGEKSIVTILQKVTSAMDKLESSLHKQVLLQNRSFSGDEIALSLYHEYEAFCSKICSFCFNPWSSIDEAAGRVVTTDGYGIVDLCKFYVLIESVARLELFRCFHTTVSKTTPLVFERIQMCLTEDEIIYHNNGGGLGELREVLATICDDIAATGSITPLTVLANARKVMAFATNKGSDRLAESLLLARIALSYCRHFLQLFRGRKNQNSTSSGVALTAYSDLTWEDQVLVEQLYELLVEVLQTGVTSVRKVKNEALKQATLRDKKSLQCDLVLTQSDFIYAMAGRLHRCKSLTKEERIEIAKRCTDYSGHLSSLLIGLKWSENNLMYFSEHKHFGYLMFRVGRIISDTVSCELAVPLYKYGTQHYKIWNPKATKEEKQKQPLHVRYEMLAQVQRKAGLYEDAMRTACDIVWPNNKKGLAVACDIWQHVKLSVIKNRGVKDPLVRRTLWTEIGSIYEGSEKGCTLIPDDVYREELTAMRETSIPPEVQMLFIEEYLQVTRLPLVKARLILFKAANAWTTRCFTYGEPEALVQESLTLVKSCDPKEKTYYDDLAMTYLLLYIVKDIDITQMVKMRAEQTERKKRKKQPSNQGNNQQDELDQAELFNNCITLAEEAEAMSPAISALESWEALADTRFKVDQFQYLGESSLAVLTLAQIFKLRDWATHEARALQLAITLAKLAKYDPTTLEATWLLCQLFNRNMQPHISARVVEETELWLGGLGPAAQRDARKSKQYVQICGAHAEALLLQNKLDEGYAELKKAFAIKRENIHPRTREDLLLEGYLCRIQARFLSLPRSFWPEGPPEDTDLPLELTSRSTRSVGGVVTSVLGNSFVNYADTKLKEVEAPQNAMEKWSLIDQLLESYYEAGAVYLQIGDAREPLVYIEQGILIARTFNLPKRRALFHMLDARLYNIGEKFTESAAHLHNVSFLFNTVTTTTTAHPPICQSNARQESQSPGNPGFQIQTLDLDFEEHVTLDPTSRPSEKVASPKHKKEQVASLGFLGHRAGCSCVSCEDLDTVRVGLYYVLCCGEMYIMEGKYSQGGDRLRGLLTQAEHYTETAVKVLENVLPPSLKTKKKQAKHVKPHPFQDIIVEGCKLMTYLSLIDLDLKAHQEWTLKLGAFLRLESYPWAVTSWVDMAESQHLSVEPSLPWPSVAASPGLLLDDICRQVDALNLKISFDIGKCTTPRKPDNSGNNLVAKAPVKRRKGLLGLMAEADAAEGAGARKKPPLTSSLLIKDQEETKEKRLGERKSTELAQKLKSQPTAGNSELQQPPVSADVASQILNPEEAKKRKPSLASILFQGHNTSSDGATVGKNSHIPGDCTESQVDNKVKKLGGTNAVQGVDGPVKVLQPKKLTKKDGALSKPVVVASKKVKVVNNSPQKTTMLAPKRTTRGWASANAKGASGNSLKNIGHDASTTTTLDAGKTDRKILGAKKTSSKSTKGKTNDKGGTFNIYVDEDNSSALGIDKQDEGKENDKPELTNKKQNNNKNYTNTKAMKTVLANQKAELSDRREEEEQFVDIRRNLNSKEDLNTNTTRSSLAKLLAELSDSGSEEDELLRDNGTNPAESSVIIRKTNARAVSNTKQRKTAVVKPPQQKLLASKPTAASKRQPKTKHELSLSSSSVLKVDQSLTNGGHLGHLSPLNKSLFKECMTKNGDVFDFECSTPEVTPSKPKRQLKKVPTTKSSKKRQTSNAGREISRDTKEKDEVLNLSAASVIRVEGVVDDLALEKPVVGGCSVNVVDTKDNSGDKTEEHAKTIAGKREIKIDNAKKTNGNSNKIFERRVTRSRMIKEDQRFDSDYDSDEIIADLNLSVVVEMHEPSSSDSFQGEPFWNDEEDMGHDRRDISLADFAEECLLLDDGEKSDESAEKVELAEKRDANIINEEGNYSRDDDSDVMYKEGDGGGMAVVIEGVEVMRGNSLVSEDEIVEIELARMDEQNESTENIFLTPTRGGGDKATKVGDSTECGDESGMEMPRKTAMKVKGQGLHPIGTAGAGVTQSLQSLTLDTPHHLNIKPPMMQLFSPVQGRTLRVGSIKHRLLQAFNLLRGHPPSVPYRQICHALTTVAISEGNAQEVAYYMTESQSVVFRHQALMNVGKRARRKDRESKGKTEVDKVKEEETKVRMKQVIDTLGFTKEVTDIDKAIDVLPTGWTVCQLCVMRRPSQDVGDLYIVNIVKGQPIIVQKLPGYSTTAGQEVLPEFAEIMRGNNISMHLKERQDWWNTRMELDSGIMGVLEKISSVWLGGGQSLLHGTPVSESKVEEIERAVTDICTRRCKDFGNLSTDRKRLLMMLLKSCHLLKEREILQQLCQVAGKLEAVVLDCLLKELKRVNKAFNLATEPFHPVVLILDRTIQQLPWENLHFLKQRPVSRVPNLYFLELLLRQQLADPNSVYNTGVDPGDAFFVLNPESNLPNTQTQFEAFFKNKLGWTGTSGTVPSVEQVRGALCKNDLYVYCGHGGGTRFVTGDTLATFQCRSCVLLMGCSSGRLIVNGKLDAYGLMLHYFLAGCPCVIANLWDVTDRDIDRLTEELIQNWTDAQDGSLITDYMEGSRKKCRLKGLIGTAPAVYGIPLRIVHKTKKTAAAAVSRDST